MFDFFIETKFAFRLQIEINIDKQSGLEIFFGTFFQFHYENSGIKTNILSMVLWLCERALGIFA